jgi:hypothetical protein
MAALILSLLIFASNVAAPARVFGSPPAYPSAGSSLNYLPGDDQETLMTVRTAPIGAAVMIDGQEWIKLAESGGLTKLLMKGLLSAGEFSPTYAIPDSFEGDFIRSRAVTVDSLGTPDSSQSNKFFSLSVNEYKSLLGNEDGTIIGTTSDSALVGYDYSWIQEPLVIASGGALGWWTLEYGGFIYSDQYSLSLYYTNDYLNAHYQRLFKPAVWVYIGEYHAGIEVRDGAELTISSDKESSIVPTLRVYGGYGSAGIGSSMGHSGGSVKIEGAEEEGGAKGVKVLAYGGEYGAGIGSGFAKNGDSLSFGNIEISGEAWVESIGGRQAAAVGSGYSETGFNTLGELSIKLFDSPFARLLALSDGASAIGRAVETQAPTTIKALSGSLLAMTVGQKPVFGSPAEFGPDLRMLALSDGDTALMPGTVTTGIDKAYVASFSLSAPLASPITEAGNGFLLPSFLDGKILMTGDISPILPITTMFYSAAFTGKYDDGYYLATELSKGNIKALLPDIALEWDKPVPVAMDSLLIGLEQSYGHSVLSIDRGFAAGLRNPIKRVRLIDTTETFELSYLLAKIGEREQHTLIDFNNQTPVSAYNPLTHTLTVYPNVVEGEMQDYPILSAQWLREGESTDSPDPSVSPTISPDLSISPIPSISPALSVSPAPSDAPTDAPTEEPPGDPDPSGAPTDAPSEEPTIPTKEPGEFPTTPPITIDPVWPDETITPTPSEAPVETATPSISPTVTATPPVSGTNTPSPKATKSPVATKTPAVTKTPTATKTPAPTSTSKKSPSPAATNTPMPTATNSPSPTATNTP